MLLVGFTRDGWEDYITWANERTTLQRINRMIEEAARDPATGIGKPERLSHNLSGYWSRRITDEHRLVINSGTKNSSSCKRVSRASGPARPPR